MATKWKSFSEQELSEFVKNSFSIRQVVEKCGYAKDSGSGALQIKKMIEYYQFDTSHFKCHAWNKGDFDYSRFEDGSPIQTSSIVPALVNLRGHRCEVCNNNVWNNQKIPLETHHRDGNKLNNSLENLQLVCPNCHALTSNYRNKGGQGVTKVEEKIFVESLKDSPNIRQSLIKIGLTPKGDNYRRARELIHKYGITHLM